MLRKGDTSEFSICCTPCGQIIRTIKQEQVEYKRNRNSMRYELQTE